MLAVLIRSADTSPHINVLPSGVAKQTVLPQLKSACGTLQQHKPVSLFWLIQQIEQLQSTCVRHTATTAFRWRLYEHSFLGLILLGGPPPPPSPPTPPNPLYTFPLLTTITLRCAWLHSKHWGVCVCVGCHRRDDSQFGPGVGLLRHQGVWYSPRLDRRHHR